MKVESLTSPGLILSAQPLGPKAERIQLSLGRVVQALVLEIRSDGRVLVEIEGQQLWARSTVQAGPGQLLNLQVQALVPELVFRALGAFERDHQAFLALCLKKGLYFMSWEALGGLLRQAQEEMEQTGINWRAESSGLFPEEFSPSRTEHWDLGKLLRASGLFLEAKLKEAVLGKADATAVFPDLKADLLRALHQASSTSSRGGSLHRMLDMLQGAQSLALLGKEQESLQLVASLPPWWMPKGSWGDLSISQWVRGKDGIPKRGWSMTLRMELEDMGKILARVYILGELLGCELKASREDVRERILEEISSLKDGLGGIWPAFVECSIGALDESSDWSEPELQLPESLLGVTA